MCVVCLPPRGHRVPMQSLLHWIILILLEAAIYWAAFTIQSVAYFSVLYSIGRCRGNIIYRVSVISGRAASVCIAAVRPAWKSFCNWFLCVTGWVATLCLFASYNVRVVSSAQNQIVLGSTPQTATLGTATAVQTGTPQRPVQGAATPTTATTVQRPMPQPYLSLHSLEIWTIWQDGDLYRVPDWLRKTCKSES